MHAYSKSKRHVQTDKDPCFPLSARTWYILRACTDVYPFIHSRSCCAQGARTELPIRSFGRRGAPHTTKNRSSSQLTHSRHRVRGRGKSLLHSNLINPPPSRKRESALGLHRDIGRTTRPKVLFPAIPSLHLPCIAGSQWCAQRRGPPISPSIIIRCWPRVLLCSQTQTHHFRLIYDRTGVLEGQPFLDVTQRERKSQPYLWAVRQDSIMIYSTPRVKVVSWVTGWQSW
ncbi:hypothetical protein B0O80DRAFT_3071 [Mortierella sp. GBAus27b]|nr:hypothetical protein B0O80DRAFT_3071 [Mortierella sp. GBAus27b]